MDTLNKERKQLVVNLECTICLCEVSLRNTFYIYDNNLIFLCEKCDTQENKRLIRVVRSQFQRAQRMGLPASLTVRQWLDTLADFSLKCAYCRKKPYQVIEHFNSVNNGGGTTKSNCVPACTKCNSAKAPDALGHDKSVTIPQKDMERVRDYLAQFEITS